MATLHEDLNQILKRVEETEEKLDFQAAEKKEVKEQMDTERTEVHEVRRPGKSQPENTCKDLGIT